MRKRIGFLSLVPLALSIFLALYPTGEAQEETAGSGLRTELPELSELPRSAWKSLHSSPIALSESGDRLFVVHTERSSLCAVDLASPRREVTERELDGVPRYLALDPRGERIYVSCSDARSVAVLDRETLKILRRISTGAFPGGLITDPGGTKLYVTESLGPAIAVFDTGTGERLRSIAVQREPRGLAVTEDGRFLLVTHLYTGVLSIIDLERWEVMREVGIGRESNLAEFVVIHSSRNEAYISHVRSRVSNPVLQFDTTILPRVSIVDLAKKRWLRSRTICQDVVDRPVNRPAGMAFSPDGRRLYIVNAGSEDMSVIRIPGGQAAGHLELGPSPRGIVINRTGERAYINCSLSGEVLVVDLKRLKVEESIDIGEIPLPAEILRGKRLFFSAALEEMAKEKWISCASCHFEGGLDGRTWLLAQGPRNTKMLRGLEKTAPYRWSGDITTLPHFKEAIRKRQGGTGLSERDNLCLSAYLASTGIRPSPYRQPDGSLTPLAERGRELFNSPVVACAVCHRGSMYTDRRKHDVGTGGDERERSGTAFDTPALAGAYESAPYLHDGSAATLEDVLARNEEDLHGMTSHLTKEERAALVEFVRSLP